ncbi:hypothetical protein SK803_36565 [Lentzea sp. BCCO 10_0856]|uniref:EspG family protein n=1 Tax=Lentzea miocenica TaxID=3095431 RepID=A0ABU4TC38_9PSEU|nr:hypothetical protein [Lentzea sp. BCCO 10_0856]MDX8035743.1 hypothetical protein [Lentzea sp. BCCO 10_0856]
MIESATYDIAVSFAEEQRAVVDEVVEACRQRGLTVLEGNELPEAQVRFFVPFVSTVDDVPPNNDDHVLPVLTGEAPESSTYLRADEGLVDALVSRVEAAETAGRDRVAVADVAATATEQPPPASTGLRALAEQFAAASPELTKRGLAGTMQLGESTIAVRVERAGDTVYALEVQRGAEETVNFVVLGGSAELFPTLCQRIEDMLTATA